MRVQFSEAWPKLVHWSRNPRVRWAVTVSLVLITLIALGAMLYKSREMLLNYEWRVRFGPLIASFLLYSLALGLAVLSWGLIMNRLVGKSNWARHARIYCLTNLARRLPGVLWYVLGRMLMYEQEGVSKAIVSISSGLEFVLLVLSGLVVSLMTWPFLAWSQFVSPWWLLIGMIAGLVAMHPAITGFALHKLGVDSRTGGDFGYRDVGSWLAIYAMGWGLGGLILYSVIATIFPIPLTFLPGIIGAWSLSGVVATLSTFSPSGFGLRELTLSLLLTLFLPSGVAVLAAILVRILLTLYEATWALVVTRI